MLECIDRSVERSDKQFSRIRPKHLKPTTLHAPFHGGNLPLENVISTHNTMLPASPLWMAKVWVCQRCSTSASPGDLTTHLKKLVSWSQPFPPDRTVPWWMVVVTVPSLNAQAKASKCFGLHLKGKSWMKCCRSSNQNDTMQSRYSLHVGYMSLSTFIHCLQLHATFTVVDETRLCAALLLGSSVPTKLP